MAKKLLRYIKANYCIECKKQFYGSIDSERSFCSNLCKETFTSKLVEAVPVRTKKKRIPFYPFECKICQKIVKGGFGTKAHRKKLCRRKCIGLEKKVPLSTNPDHLVVTEKFKKQSEIKQKQYGESFYTAPAWLQVRYQALAKYGRRCQLCFASEVKVHVDHIKPRSKYPELELDINNLQVLCEPCNLGKGAWDETDWR